MFILYISSHAIYLLLSRCTVVIKVHIL